MAQRLPSLVIIGRPNVGKSTLFNRLTGTRRSIVTNEPGITRDRIYGKAEWRGRAMEIVDTGGIVPDDKALIPQEILRQAHVAIAKADLLVLVADSFAGLTPLDEELARLLRGRDIGLVVYDETVREAAQNRLDTTLAQLREVGIEADGEVMDPDPYNATMDAFHTYGAHHVLVALTVFTSLIGVVTFGTLAGSLLPFVLRGLGFDPASASAPFVATLVDVTGLIIYFTTASTILRGTLL